LDTGAVSRPSYKRHRFPPEIIAYAVWLYYQFALSFRDVEELMASKGVIVSYEAVRLWCGKFGPDFVRKLRPHGQRLGRRWFVDEVFIRINGTIHYLWRAVDPNGVVVHILVQAKRDRAAAERFFHHVLHSSDTVPHTVVTDRLRSNSAALPHVLPKVKHQRGHWLNNRAENSHQPTRERERRMCRFKSPEQAQQFLSIHSTVSSHFRPRRHRLTAARYRAVRRQRFRLWNTTVQAGALDIS
jgi:putative transposase